MLHTSYTIRSWFNVQYVLTFVADGRSAELFNLSIASLLSRHNASSILIPEILKRLHMAIATDMGSCPDALRTDLLMNEAHLFRTRFPSLGWLVSSRHSIFGV